MRYTTMMNCAQCRTISLICMMSEIRTHKINKKKMGKKKKEIRKINSRNVL